MNRLYSLLFTKALLLSAIGIMTILPACDQADWRNPTSKGGRTLFGRQDSPSASNKGQWTIECRVETGPDHERNTNALADMLRRTPDLSARQVRTEHDADTSRIFYGAYRRTLDQETGLDRFPPEVQQTIRYIRQLRMNPSRQPFIHARCVPIATPDEGPPEWDLRRADCMYSLQIAVFYNRGDFTARKKAAVEYAKHWRSKGYDAFYFHGPVRSHTLVGKFDKSALTKTRTGKSKYAKQVIDLQNKEPEFAWNIENGRKIGRVHNKQSVTQRSFLINVEKARENQ